MRILILSDLNWNVAAKRLTMNDINYLFESRQIPKTEKFRSINNYWDRVISEKPDLILLAGDLTGDGSCGHGFHMAFYYLLCLMDLSKTRVFFIRGDNDLDEYYLQIIINLPTLNNVEEISGRMVIFKGLRILGIPFQLTRDKIAFRKFKEAQMHVADIVLAHSELKRRTALFNLPATIFISGHFDNKLCAINEKVFLSLSNDSDIINYAVIYYHKNEWTYSYRFFNSRKKSELSYMEDHKNLTSSSKRAETLFIDDIPVDIKEFENLALPASDYEKGKNALAFSIKYLRGQNYSTAIAFLRQTKKMDAQNIKMLTTLRKEFITARHKLSKSMILDYLGNAFRKYL